MLNRYRLIAASLFAGIFLLILSGFWLAQSVLSKHAPLVDAAMEIQLKVTTAHLWLEEVLSGDQSRSVEIVWDMLDQADWYAQAMLQGGDNFEGRFVASGDEPVIQEVKATQVLLAQFRKLAQQRWNAASTSGIGSELDQEFDLTYERLIEQADLVETKLQMAIERSKRQIGHAVLFLLGLVALFGGLLFWLMQRFGEQSRRMVELSEAANRQKSLFLANMSHEIRTPLNSINGFSEIMLSGLGGELSDTQREFVNNINQSGEHLLNLVNDLLDLSKIEAGQLHAQPAVLRVDQLLDYCASHLRGQAESKGLKLSVTQPNDRQLQVDFWYDPNLLRQVLLNLLSNAVKFTDHGEVELGVRWHERLGQAPSLGPQEGWLEFWVRDTGIGIAPEDQIKLYQPFVQLEQPYTKRFAGTGLGLALVQRIVKHMGGFVELQSKPLQGSRFSVMLPGVFPPAELLSRQKPAGEVDFSGRQLVLLIEDTAEDREQIRQEFEQLGFVALQAASALEGFDLAKRHRPDLISLDIRLPDRDGWDLLQRLRAEPSLTNTPVLVVSHLSEESAPKDQATLILPKPLNRPELIQALSKFGIARRGGLAEKVLIVDHENNIQTLFGELLREQGHQVFTATSVNQGLEMLKETPPDLVVLDLMMPGRSGFEMAQALWADPKTAEIPILILTAKDLDASDYKQLKSNVSAVLQKSPHRPAEFVNLVRQVLDGRSKNPA
ncbi:MAG: response regulator [bacterium]|nr:response regulator [bacterium]